MIQIQFLRRMKKYLWFSLILFIVGALAGALLSTPLQAELSPLMKDLKTIAAGMRNQSFSTMMMMLFVHNLRTSLFMIAGGIVFGIMPVLFVVVNGAIVGYVIAITYHLTHVNPFLIFAAGILPHGLFEITAYILASAYGMRLGVLLVRSMRRRFERDNWQRIGKDLLPTLLIVVVFLFIAANIEAGVTPIFLRMIIHKG